MNLSINLENTQIDFEVEYRKRKTISIRIAPTGRIQVIAPMGLSNKAIEELVKSKSKWIAKKLNELEEIDYRPYDRKFVDGEFFMYLGKKLYLKVGLNRDIRKPSILDNNSVIYIKTPKIESDLLKELVVKWYKEKCLENIIERIDYYKEIIGVQPRKVKVKEQKKRWGSCTSRGDLLFNWRCIMAPQAIVDYIVVHEMCHLAHMNHSKEFWKLVEYIQPDFKERKAWLKKYGVTLDMYVKS